MIKCIAFDVEVLPNLFSIVFINLNDYLIKFSDREDEKGKAIPLTECLSVKKIKERLDNVESKTFYITDTDDNQLLSLVDYINKMSAYFIDKVTPDGEAYQEACRTDLYAYNSLAYDDLMISYFLMHFNRCNSTKELITKLYNFSKSIIRHQDDDSFYTDQDINLARSYKLPYASVDLFKLFGLNSAGVIVDNDTGERKKFGKSLKQTSINAKWYEILEFNLPPICDKDKHYYNWKEYSLEELNKIISPFDRFILPEYVETLCHYNKNDVFIVCELARLKSDEIKLRYSITSKFHMNVLSSARSNISDKLVTSFYSKMSGLHKTAFEKLKTERTALSFKKIIFPHIKFKTKQLQDLLDEMKTITIYRTNKDSFNRTVDFCGTKYTLATGGIHSVDYPRILKSTDEYTYVHWDYTSYYPSIMISYEIAPKHLNKKVFVKMIKYFKDTRVEAKHTKDDVKQVISGVPNKITAEVLKIVINAIYGKLGSDLFFLYDRFAQMQVTINGQLMTMTLVEELELNGIHVVSANTDGIIIKLPNDKRDVFKDITDRWNETNKMSADGEEYKYIVSRDVNNYFDLQVDDTVEFKGAFDPNMFLKDLKKGYDMPIVAKAVIAYFKDNIPITKSLYNATDILDFCKTQNIGKKFKLCYYKVKDGKPIKHYSQRNCRFYISKNGVRLLKEDEIGKTSQLASGYNATILNTLTDDPITTRNIDYGYYYNECMKLIDPILLNMSPKKKSQIKKVSGMYKNLFDEDE